MNIEICNDNYTYIWNQHIPLGAWYGQDENGWWFCTKHKMSKDTLTLRRFNGVRWLEIEETSRTTQNICAWATHRGLWWTKSQWLMAEDRKKSLVARHDSHRKSYQNMMKHDRKHKKSGSGIRLDKENFFAYELVTDYACSNKSEWVSYR